jgi:hypothetical protein
MDRFGLLKILALRSSHNSRVTRRRSEQNPRPGTASKAPMLIDLILKMGIQQKVTFGFIILSVSVSETRSTGCQLDLFLCPPLPRHCVIVLLILFVLDPVILVVVVLLFFRG